VIGGKLYSDALDAPNTPAGSYLGMVRSNVEVVAKALRAP
jgi:ABC-type Zn uptake system ZnuABC Zn-binding protein ZnuA